MSDFTDAVEEFNTVDFTDAMSGVAKISNYISALLCRVEHLTNENEFLKSLTGSFWTGDVPDSATLDHMILAKAGRLRLEAKSKVCTLLGG